MRHQNRITKLHKRKIKFSLQSGQTTGGYHVKEMVRKKKSKIKPEASEKLNAESET